MVTGISNPANYGHDQSGEKGDEEGRSTGGLNDGVHGFAQWTGPQSSSTQKLCW